MTPTHLTYTSLDPFPLELGGFLPGLTVGYHTYGNLNAARNNVVWICHALTANSDPLEWWPGMTGKGKLYDPDHYFIVCANMLGSCYGTSGPLSEDPSTGSPWYRRFPEITIRDMAAAHELLRKHLGIASVHTVIGGSIGGHQSMEWAIACPDLFRNMILLASSAMLSPWAIAFNQAQRMAIEADRTFYEDIPGGGLGGLKAARAVALLSYRNRQAYNQTQEEGDDTKTAGFRASTYQTYQGEKLVKRFNAYSYHVISRAMDTHNVARGRGNFEQALGQIRANTLAVGISTDILFPPEEMKNIIRHIQGGLYSEITSAFGHDGFLIENEQLTNIIQQFYNTTQNEPAN